jgi:P2 family phage contractile tail tube protein
MIRPEAYIDFAVYENSRELLGTAKATLPDIKFLTQTITGAGVAGNVEAVLRGMVDTMNLTLEFISATDSAVRLATPVKHNIDLRVAEQQWDTVGARSMVAANKFVLVVIPKGLTVGSVAPASPADASGEYAVYYYAAYKGKSQLWEIDPYNYICKINGVDYMKDVRAALGK